MKKVFMSAAVIAMMICAAACGNNNSKKAESAHEDHVWVLTERAADGLGEDGGSIPPFPPPPTPSSPPPTRSSPSKRSPAIIAMRYCPEMEQYLFFVS